MNKEEFYAILNQNNIPIDIVAFDDYIQDDIFCINKIYQNWEVFYRERGKEFRKRVFNNESDALKYALQQIL